MEHTDMPARTEQKAPPIQPHHATDIPRLLPSALPPEDDMPDPPVSTLQPPADTDRPETSTAADTPFTPEEAPAPTLPDTPSGQPAEMYVSPRGLRMLPILSFCLRVLCLLLCICGAAVYALTVYFRGTSLLSGGIGRLVLGEIAGGGDMVTVQTLAQSPAQLPDTALPPLTTVVPVPANEAESGTPSYNAAGENRLCEDLSSRAADGLGLINETPYIPSLSALAESALPIRSLANLQAIYGEDAPLCLILHTHGTEGYIDSAAAGYHTADAENSVIRLGAALSDILNANGIPTIHCETAFDANRFDSAYYNASLYIREMLTTHPSIQYIFDIHRDAIEWTGDSGNVYGVAPYAEIDGLGTAQLMFVVGTDHGGSGHTGWQDNLTLAVHLQRRLHGTYPGLCRDINLRSASFNEQYTKGSLLIEVGAASSALEEALRAIRYLAEAMTAVIRGE